MDPLTPSTTPIVDLTSLTKSPQDFVTSVISSSWVTLHTQFVHISGFSGKDHAELSELLVYSDTGTGADQFALAIKTPSSSFSPTSPSLNQEGVLIVGDFTSKFNRIDLRTALAKREQIYFFSSVDCSYRLSGKVVTT